jgi:hypothetical protein
VADRVEVLITGDASRLGRAAEDAKASLTSLGRSAQEAGRAIASSFTQANLERGVESLKTGLGALSGGLTKIAAPLFAADIAFKALDSTIGSVVASWDKYTSKVAAAETATLRLTALYDGNAEAIGRVRDLTKQLASQSSFFGAGAITNAAIVLKNFDATEEQIKTLLPAAVKLSTLFGTDLEETTRKFAIGLTGATRGLREFGIVVPAGASQADVFRLILEKAAKAEGVMNEANDTLAASQRNLTKAQGGYNKAIGEFLAGPAKAYNDFLAGLYVSVTKLIKAVGDFGKAWESSMTGGQEGIRLEPLGTRRSYGPSAPGTAAGMALAADKTGRRVTASDVIPVVRAAGKEAGIQWAKAVEDSKATSKPTVSKPAAKPADDPVRRQQELIRQQDEARAFERQLLEDRIAANEAQIVKDNQAAQEIIDNFDAANRKRNEETVRTFEKAQDLMLSAADKTAGLIGKALSGQALQAQDFVGLGTMIATAIFPAFGPLISILGTFLGALTGGGGGPAKVTSTAEDKARLEQLRQEQSQARGVYETELSFAVAQNARKEQIAQLEQQILEKERVTADTNAETAERNRRAAQEQQRGGIQDIIDMFRSLEEKTARAFLDMAKSFTVTGEEAASYFKAFGELNKMTPDEIKSLGSMARQSIKTGDESALRSRFSYLTEDQFQALLATLAQVPEATDAPGLGDTPRNPLYVFDVTPSKDEFTRAPRGMFFRPVGSGRGVDAGQSVSGVSSNTTNRAGSLGTTAGRTNRRMTG